MGSEEAGPRPVGGLCGTGLEERERGMVLLLLGDLEIEVEAVTRWVAEAKGALQTWVVDRVLVLRRLVS